MRVLLEEGWVDRLAYEGDVEDMLKERTDGKPDELRQVQGAAQASSGKAGVCPGLDLLMAHSHVQASVIEPLTMADTLSVVRTQVGYQKYSRVSPSAFQIGAGKACVAVLRASGAITGTGGGGTSQGITGELRAVSSEVPPGRWLQLGEVAEVEAEVEAERS